MARVTFFAFDIAEAAQVRRIRSIRSLGHEVVSFSFRRDNMNDRFEPDWPDVPLGRSTNRQFLRRFLLLWTGLFRAWRGRQALAGSEVWIARNVDLLLIARAMQILTRSRDVRLVYECLDIHGLFTRGDLLGAAMRWVERRLLARTDLLVISSPGFRRAYFEPVQRFPGPVALIENKLWLGEDPMPRPAEPRPVDAQRPLVLGWVGSLRCADSLRILAETAEAMGPEVAILFRGNVHRHAVPDFDAMVERYPNIAYGGPYRYPDELGAVYAACDLVWAQDLWQAGANSDWLLPNRIYEASYFGCPSVALAGTETGRRIASAGLGFTVDAASGAALTALLRRLGREEIRAASHRLLSMPDSAFRLYPDELANLLSPVLRPPRRSGIDAT